jgi:hypothetical protein
VALRAGIALQLVWLSIGAARGSRRPNAVVGGVVGAAAACLSMNKSGDPREPLVVAGAVLCGLLAGEAAQWAGARAGVAREKWLEKFQLPGEPLVASRNLTLHVVGSAAYVALVDGLLAAILVAIALPATELVIDRAGSGAAGVTAWLGALPAIAVATIAHAFATKTLGRIAAVGMLVAVVTAWLI